MEALGLALGLIGIGVSIAIAIWQHSKAKTAERHLASVLGSLPNALLDVVKQVLASKPHDDGGSQSPEIEDRRFQAHYADLDGDGEDELLLEVDTGAYASVLLVYGVQSWELKKLGELYSTTIGGFEVGDLDGDGRIEVRTNEIARRPDLPYVAGLRDEVVYRFQKGEFVELSRKECFTEEEMKERQAAFASDA